MNPRIVLITGANSGIGYATSKVIVGASEAFHVIMAGRSLDRIETAKAEIQASGVRGQLSSVQLDVTDGTSISEAVSLVDRKFGRLDVLINNAGIATTDFRTCTEVNVMGPSLVTAAFRDLLLKSQAPYSIYVSSVVGSLTLASDTTSPYYNLPAGGVAYRSSKAALNMSVIEECKKASGTPLKVFAMCPGFVVSNIRGPSEAARTAGGKAGDPTISGQTILSIIEGKRGEDQGRLIHKDGVYPW